MKVLINMKNILNLILIFSIFIISSCQDSEESSTVPESDNNSQVTIPLAVFQKVYGAASDIYIQDGYAYINTKGMPDHQSPYYLNTQWESTLYAEYDGSNPYVSGFNLNPNRISELSLSFKIPVSPKKSSSNNSTSMGPIGVSLNGVPFYNQYAGGGATLTQEINSFDQYNGHPAPLRPGQGSSGGKYHYHMEPFWLTEKSGKAALLGFLLDGFPVYGPLENNKTIISSDLDDYHGHYHSTSDFNDGIYHYHVTADDPYINGSGYYGTPGTVSE